MEFDSTINDTLQSYLNHPFNVKSLVDGLKNMRHLELCLVISGLHHYYEKFEDYYAVWLYDMTKNIHI